MNKLRTETGRFVVSVTGEWSYNNLPKGEIGEGKSNRWNLTSLGKILYDVACHSRGLGDLKNSLKSCVSIGLAESPHASVELFADTSTTVTTAHRAIQFILNSLFHSELYLYFKIPTCKTLTRHNCSVILSVPTAESQSRSSRSHLVSQAICV